MTEIINTPSSRDPFQLELYEAVKNYKSRNTGTLKHLAEKQSPIGVL